MVDFRKENEYFLSFSNKFLEDFGINKENFIYGVKKYINDFYLTSRPQYYSVNIGKDIIKFHKVDVEDNNKSGQKAKRIIIFILLNTPEGKNTIYPAFAFSTQEEKVYNQKLKTPNFVKTLRLKLEKYNINNENLVKL